MADERVEHAMEPTTGAMLRTVALAIVGFAVGAVIAVVGLVTLMSLWWQVMWNDV